VGQADVLEIDRINILQATMLAMRRAVEGLSVAPGEAWIDGDRCPAAALCDARHRQRRSRCRRDSRLRRSSPRRRATRCWSELDGRYPLYGFAHNRGYGTPEHLAALQRHGPCPAHRRIVRAGRADVVRLLKAGPSIRRARCRSARSDQSFGRSRLTVSSEGR
jgi:ribonuclease HII